MPDLSRVVVIGSSGAGKTTLARRLARALGSPCIELDALYWQPHWTPRPAPDFCALVEQASATEQWVIDGNYTAVQPLVWSRATAVVWLNYGFLLILGRLLRRTVHRSLTGEELFAGNRESLRKAFLSRESILWWLLSTYRRRRRRYRALFADPRWAALTRIELRRPADAKAFLAAVTAGCPTRSTS